MFVLSKKKRQDNHDKEASTDEVQYNRIHKRNPGEGEIFCTRAYRPGGPPSLIYKRYWVYFPGLEPPGRGVNHPSHVTPRLKKE